MFFEALGRSRPPRSRRPGLGKSPFPGRGTAAAVALHTCPGNRRPCARRSNDRRDVPRACRNHLAGQVMSQALREVSTPRRYPPGFWRKALDLIEVGRRPHRRRERPCRRLPCRFLHIPRPPVTESGLRSRQPSGAGEVVEHAVIETRRRGRSHLPLRAPTRRSAGPVGAPQGPRGRPRGGVRGLPGGALLSPAKARGFCALARHGDHMTGCRPTGGWQVRASALATRMADAPGPCRAGVRGGGDVRADAPGRPGRVAPPSRPVPSGRPTAERHPGRVRGRRPRPPPPACRAEQGLA
jgi:hypothetical protein